jgi:dCTP deaminase
MSLPQDLPRVFYSVGVRIETLTDRLNNLPMEEFPTESGEKLVSLFIKGAKRLRKRLERHAGDWLDGTRDRESIQGAVRRIGNSAAILYSYLEYIEAFVFEKTRSEVIVPFELLMKDQFPQSKDDVFIFYPQWEFNFTYLNLKEELTEILFLFTPEDEQEFFTGVGARIAIISFPALERDNILALIVLAHELAHYFDEDPDCPGCRISKSRDVEKAVSYPKERIKNWIQLCKQLDPAPDVGSSSLSNIIYELRIMSKLQLSIPYWLRELTADILAARLFGIGFYVSMKELLNLIVTPIDSPYPPNSKRLAEIAKEISGPSDGFEKDIMDRIGKHLEEGEKRLLEQVQKMMSSDSNLGDAPSVNRISSEITASQLTVDQRKEVLDKEAVSIIEQAITPAMDLVRQKVRQRIPLDSCLRLSKDVLVAARYLKNYIPPVEKLGTQPIKEPETFDIRKILNTVWIRWLEIIDEFSVSQEIDSQHKPGIEKYYRKLIILSRLSLRAIELSNFRSQYTATDPSALDKAYKENEELIDKSLKMDKAGVLGKKEIVNLMGEDLDKSLVIMPLLDPSQIAEASIDLTLGNAFIVMRRTRLPSLPFREISQKVKHVNVFELHERIQLRPDRDIVLHPGEFFLGSTLEYIALPNDVMAYVIGKSSLGRVGLVIATATHVAPGFKGTITLELSNLGSLPLLLYPTMPVAQLVFHRLCTPVKQGYSATDGEYAYSTGPVVSKYLLPRPPI